MHTVGPVWHGGTQGEADVLASSYRSSIQLADSVSCHTIAFPSISTGIFGYPAKLAAPVALEAVRAALRPAEHVRDVTFVLHDRATMRAYEAAAGALKA